jgi:hypothetical protein
VRSCGRLVEEFVIDCDERHLDHHLGTQRLARSEFVAQLFQVGQFADYE